MAARRLFTARAALGKQKHLENATIFLDKERQSRIDVVFIYFATCGIAAAFRRVVSPLVNLIRNIGL